MSINQGDIEQSPLLVIGAGVGRTGTKSLKDALEILYNKPCYHMYEIVRKQKQHVKLWTQLFDMLDQDPNAELPWDVIKRIFKGYASCTDNPACAIYKQLMEMYPNAKIILTVRDPKKWLESIRSTVIPKKPLIEDNWFGRLKESILIAPGFHHMAHQSMTLALGSKIDLMDDEQMIREFVRHNDEVKRVVPTDRLLVYQVKEGWEPLCQFLGKPIPDVPFPCVNDRKELQNHLNRMRLTTYTILASTAVVIVAGVAMAVRIARSNI